MVKAWTGSPCPPKHAAVSLAVAYGELIWTRLRCVGTFWPRNAFTEAAFMADVRPHGENWCEVRLQQLGGELRILMDSSFLAREDGMNVLPNLDEVIKGESMRLDRGEQWARVDTRMCALDARVGYLPLARPVTSEIQAFAVRALNDERSVRKCGSPVHIAAPKGAAEPWPKAGIMGRSIQLQFPLILGTSPLVEHVVFLAVEVFKQWDAASQVAGEDVFTFLGSDPSPCDVGRLSSSVHSEWWSHAPGEMTAPPQSLRNDFDDATKHNLEHFLDLLPRAAPLADNVLRAKGLITLPRFYDWRDNLPQCARAPRAQGRCTKAWALAAAGAFEKQLCVLTEGASNIRISAQHILDCGKANNYLEGRLEDAYKFLYRDGALREECAPWSAPLGLDSHTRADASMPVESLFPPPNFTLFLAGRPAPSTERTCFADRTAAEGQSLEQRLRVCAERFRVRMLTQRERLSNVWPGAPPGLMVVEGERMIQAAIFAYAAVASTIQVYADFLAYTGGVYRRSSKFVPDDILGLTTVQLFGWGVEPGILGARYWIGENSFGSAWGEGGYFKWSRGEDHLGIETNAQIGLVAGLFPLEVNSEHPHRSSGAGHDDSSARENPDMLTSLREEAVIFEDHVATIRAVNWWLSCSSIIFALIASISVAFSVRRCICLDEEDEDETGSDEDKKRPLD